MMLAVFIAACAVAIGAASHFTQRVEQARTALNDGQVQMDKEEWEGAIHTLQSGLAAARDIPFQSDLAGELERRLHLAEQERTKVGRTAAIRDLHRLADRIRFLYGADHSAPEGLRGLEASCRGMWECRERIAERLSPDGGHALDPTVRDDLLDLAIFWADLQVRLAPADGKQAARGEARTVLAQAEALFGPSPVLDEARKPYGAPTASLTAGYQWHAQPTAWDHYALARALLRSGELERAAAEAERAVRLQPQGLWPNFYQGLCAYRLGRYAAAVRAYSVCIGAAPEAVCCFYNRALAFEGLGDAEQALNDYDLSLRLDPTLSPAALNRGMLHYRAKRYADALADLQRAGELGADPAVVAYDRALVHLARGEQAVALDDLRRALSFNPHHADARKLHDRLLGR
jgi:Flp pilus assembly protein TadD